jgi:TonB-dependent receptor
MYGFCNSKTIRAALLLSGSAIAFAGAASAATLQGSVTDAASHSALPGASITVDGVEINADRNGAFFLSNIKPGHYTLSVDYVGYPVVKKDIDVVDGKNAAVNIPLAGGGNVETVVVTGQRQAQRIALQTKKIADNFLDALASNDVGKLPDQNVAEAVRRIPGVSVTNDQGEGRYVVIRGVAPELANVTLNGATAPAPEPDGRQVKLDDIPSSLISSLQVIKTLTPDLDANAIAGQVNIDTISAFDRDDAFAFGRLAYGYYDMNGKSPYEGDLTVGSKIGPGDQFGLVVSANYSRRDIESQNFGSGGPDWSTSTNSSGYATPSLLQLRDYNLVRKRSGLVANFDWHPTAGTKFYLRTTYSTFSDSETRDRFTITLPSSVTATSSTSGSYSGGTANRYVRFRTESDHTLDLTFGGSTRLGEGELSFEGGYAHAVKTDPNRNEYTFKAKKISGTYDTSSFLYDVTANSTAYTPSSFALNKVVHASRLADEDLYQGRADYLLPVTLLSDDDSIKFGFKIVDRSKSNDQKSATLKPTSTNATAMTLADVDYYGKETVYDGRYTFGPRVSYSAADAYVLTNHGTLGCDSSTTGGIYCDTATSLSDSISSDYDLHERIVSGYAMATLKFDGLTLIPGVRVEATDGTYKGKIYYTGMTTDPGFNSVGKTSYTDVFPGLNARYDVAEDFALRGAVTTAIGRPNYEDLAPYVTVDTSENTVAEGNPDLKPLRSTNLDLAAEYYLPQQGVISLSVFYKNISDPIYSASYTASDTFAGQTLTDATVTQSKNATRGIVRGLEFNAQVQFDFLPSPLDGFGVDANYAYIDSAATGAADRTDKLPLFDQSKNVANLQLLYEKYGFSARLAYSYRSHFLDTVGTDKTTDVYEDNHGQLDARLSYQVLESATLFVEANNLTDTPWRRYIGSSDHVYENERYGWSMRGGLQFKF